MALTIKELDILEFEKGYNERVEKIILGNMLVDSFLDSKVIKDVILVLKSEDFLL